MAQNQPTSRAFSHSNGLKDYIGPPKKPVPEGYQEYLEIGIFEDPVDSYCLEIQLSDDDLERWLHPNSTYPFAKEVNGKPPSKALRLVICALPAPKFQFLPFGVDGFKRLQALYDLEQNFFQVEDLCGPNLWFQTLADDGTSGLVVQLDKFNKAVSAFKLSMTYKRTSTITCGVVRVLINKELEHVRSRVQSLCHHMWHPAMLPLIIAETRTHDTPAALVEHKETIAKLEKDAGVYKNKNFGDSLNPNTLAPSETRDFDNILNGIIPVRTDCDYLLSKGQTVIDFLGFIEAFATEYQDQQPDQENLTNLEKSSYAACKSKVAYQKSYAANTQARCRYISDRVKALADQCYNLMGQKDNYLNLRTASISLEIANLSREDNLQMKEIALSTQRDSMDMRSIAVLTLVFLPPTFTATFFSTSFYDFSPGDGKIVSHFHWVYWVVTGGLTLCVLCLWLLHVKLGLLFWKARSSDAASGDAEKNTIFPKISK